MEKEMQKKGRERGRNIDNALWSRTAKNPDVSTGPLSHPFALFLSPLTCSLARPCLFHLRAVLLSLIRSLTHSLTLKLVND